MFVGLLDPILPSPEDQSVKVSHRDYETQRNYIEKLIADRVETRAVGFFAPYPPSTDPVTATNSTIRDLEKGCRLTGLELLLRIVASPTPYLGRLVLAEDIEGTTARFVLFNTGGDIPTHELLAKDTFVCVRQCICEAGIGAAIKVEHPNDIDILSIYDERVQKIARWSKAVRKAYLLSANAWIDQASLSNKQQQFWKAYRCYSEALRCPNSTNTELQRLAKLRRAAIALKLHHYEDAINDCLDLEDDTIARRLMAQAYWGLRRYEDAVKMFQTTEPFDDLSKSALQIYESCLDQSLGKTELPLGLIFSNTPETAIVADCLVKIEIREGRMFLKEDVTKGSLIFYERALISDRETNDEGSFAWKVPSISFSPVKSHQGSGPSPLAERMTDRLLHNGKHLMPAFNQIPRLTKGDLLYLAPDGRLIVDTPKVQELVSLHAFPLIDFELLRIRPRSACFIDAPKGFFVNAAFMRPACLPNTHWAVGADVLLVSAADDLIAGTELTKFLGGVDWASKELRDTFWKSRQGKICECEICSWDSKHPNESLKESNISAALVVIETEFDDWLMSESENTDLLNRLQETLMSFDKELEAMYETTGKAIRWQFFRHRIWRDLSLIAAARQDVEEYSKWRAKLRLGRCISDDVDEPKKLTHEVLEENSPCACIALCECD